MDLNPLRNRFFSVWDEWQDKATTPRADYGSVVGLWARRLRHAAEVDLVVARRNREQAGVRFAFFDVGEQHGGVLGDHLDGQMQLLIDPQVSYASLFVGDFPVI